jgi:hypothetical protein
MAQAGMCKVGGDNSTTYLNVVNGRLICPFFKDFFMAQEPLVGQDLLITRTSRSHSDTPHSVGLLWTSDQPDSENST